jgi:hypothetical protein
MALVVTNNSPSPGYVAWTGLTIERLGNTYNVSAGNSNKIYLWWDYSAPTILQESNTLPILADEDIIVFVNRSGVHYLIPQSTIYIKECLEPKIITDTALGALTGWIDANETWTFDSAANTPEFTLTIVGDKTAKYSPGMRVMLTQTTIKWFVVTKVSYSSPNTTLTLYGGNTYSLANAAISLNYYSPWYAPLGFPLERSVWDLVTTLVGNQGNPVQNTWYNAAVISLPIGDWTIDINCLTYWYLGGVGAGQFSGSAYVTLSTANNTESDSTSTRGFEGQVYEGAGYTWNFKSTTVLKEQKIITAKTSWYANFRTIHAGVTGVNANGDLIARFNYI